MLLFVGLLLLIKVVESEENKGKDEKDPPNAPFWLKFQEIDILLVDDYGIAEGA